MRFPDPNSDSAEFGALCTSTGISAAKRRQAAAAHHVLLRCRQIVVQQDGIKAIVNAMAAHTDSMALSGS